ncbi:MAG: glycosyltransferase [Candidatus Hydrogenedentes bacterium]|nr:glycosyltransferase [Candidatus Hydrogenedentota bacterium]
MSRVLRRVCYIIPSLAVGGTEKQLVYLTKGLALDHEITVVCTGRAGTFAGDVRRTGAYVRELELWGGWDFRLRHRLMRVFHDHRPDIVHTFLSGFDLAANRAARAAGVPVVVSSRRELATWARARHIRHQRKANALVDCIVANSHAAADFAAERERAEPGLFRVIPNGIPAADYAGSSEDNLLRHRFNIPFHTKVVGIVANFSAVKDHALFVEMAAELGRRREDVHFLMVGTGPLLDQTLELVRRAGLADRCTRVTALEEMRDLYALMAVSILCSKVEGFPNAVIESMAAGKPVVAAAVGGIPEVVRDGETGRLVASRSAGDFANAVQWVLEHPDESKAMALRGQAHVTSHLTVDAMVSAHRRLYAELLVGAMRGG